MRLYELLFCWGVLTTCHYPRISIQSSRDFDAEDSERNLAALNQACYSGNGIENANACIAMADLLAYKASDLPLIISKTNQLRRSLDLPILNNPLEIYSYINTPIIRAMRDCNDGQREIINGISALIIENSLRFDSSLDYILRADSLYNNNNASGNKFLSASISNIKDTTPLYLSLDAIENNIQTLRAYGFCNGIDEF